MSDSEPRPESLVPPGNRMRPWRALVVLAGLAPVFLILSSDQHYSFSVPIGLFGCLVAAYGVLDLLGTFDDAGEVKHAVELRALAAPGLELVAGAVALVASLRLAVSGILPHPILSSGLLITGELLWILVSGYRVLRALGQFGSRGGEGVDERGLTRREGFWLLVLNVLLYVPLLGSYSLSDPWETHYGEVAREMLARDDWISLWWAQDGWFWSKPVLDFWVQGLSFSLGGVRFMPDQMLAGAAVGRFPQPEWAARLPIALFAMLATYLLYKAVAAVLGRRAGLLAGVVLTTMPYWFLIAHQSMTDMMYVAPLTAGLAMLALGLRTDPQARAGLFELRVAGRALRLSAFHPLFLSVLLSVLPQLVYLVTRHVSLQLAATPHGFRWHWDEFFAGSGGGNCGLPGNEACHYAEPFNRLLQPGLSALLWAVVLGVLLYLNRGERRLQRLYFLWAWYFTALSALAKGAPGLVLPVVIALCAVGALRRYADLTRLEWTGLLLLVGCVCLPWYVQDYVRHGPPFVDRLIFHDMYKRAFVHVHDTNTGDDVSFRYYVWQLGYGLFPWTGLAAAALLWWLRADTAARDARAEFAVFLAMWFVLSFSMFTISLTKFHHYVLPVVPALAAFTGVLLDRALGGAPELGDRRSLLRYVLSLSGGAALVLYGVMRLVPGALDGHLAQGKPPPASPALGLVALASGLALSAYAAFRAAPSAATPLAEPDFSASQESSMLGLLGVCAAVPVLLAGHDLFSSFNGDMAGPTRLVHLFTYNYRRPWPDSLHFEGVMIAFTAVSMFGSALFLIPALRRHAVLLCSVVAVLWTLFGLDVYLVGVAPHWGQRETLLTYYRERKGPEEPIVAYQMNWKGENFYTGNRVPAFVSSGAKFKSWVAEQKAKGVRVMYFTTEHGRINGLKSELGTVKDFKVLTTRELNNKFMLARVEL